MTRNAQPLTAFQRFRRIPLIHRIDARFYHVMDWFMTTVLSKPLVTKTALGFVLAAPRHKTFQKMRSGVFEEEEIDIFRTLLANCDVFIDVGANVGYYTCLAMQKDKKVIAFEPQVRNVNLLSETLAHNGWSDRVEVFPIALGEKISFLPLFGASSLSASLVKSWAGYGARHSQQVPVNTLDNVLSGRFKDQRLIIKVDVEGAEIGVLRGAIATLARSPKPVWLIEICFNEFHPQGMNPDFVETFKMFFDNGYICYCADDSKQPIALHDILEWVANGKRGVGTFNYVFTGQ